jgi:CRP-like cAMP-binding protein
VPFPFRQQDLADALGLSIVHTNRRIVALRQAGLVEVAARRLVVHDLRKLSSLAQIEMKKDDVRPIL